MKFSILNSQYRVFALCALCVLLLNSAQAAHVLFNMADFTSGSITGRTLRLLPLSTPRVNEAEIISNDRLTWITDTSGSVTASNIVFGNYKVQFVGPFTTTEFTILVPDTNITLNATGLITGTITVPAGTVGYSQAAADGRFVKIRDGWSTNQVLTNPVVRGLRLPDFNAAAGRIWVCTNATTGQGEWQTVAAGSGGQPASANLTNWSNVETNQYIRSTNGTGSGIQLYGTSTVARILYRGNTSYVNATNSLVGGGQGNNVSNVSMFVWGNENTTWGESSFEEGYGMLAGYRNYGGGDAVRINEPWFGFGAYHQIANSPFGFIAGGESNKLGVVNNTADSPANHSFIGAGTFNAISNATHSSIGGGISNVIRGTIISYSVGSAIGGGTLNVISNSSFAFIAGGASNEIRGANGAWILGEQLTNTTANTGNIGMHDTSKIIVTETETTFRSNVVVNAPVEINTAANPNTNSFQIRTNSASAFHFVVRSNGNVGIFTNNPQQKLHVNGSIYGEALLDVSTIAMRTSPNTDYVLMDDGNGVGNAIWGRVQTSGLVDNAVSNAKLRDSAALSVIGRTANSSGDPADIAAAANGQYLKRTNDTVVFGVIGSDDLPGTINGGHTFASWLTVNGPQTNNDAIYLQRTASTNTAQINLFTTNLANFWRLQAPDALTNDFIVVPPTNHPSANQLMAVESYGGSTVKLKWATDGGITGITIQTNGVNVGTAITTVNWTTGVTGNVSGATVNLGTSGSGSGSAVGTESRTEHVSTATWSDNLDLYVGWSDSQVAISAANYNIVRIPIMKTGTIKRIHVEILFGTAGSGETVTGYIRINDTTDIGTLTWTMDGTSPKTVIDSSVSHAVTAGDFWCFKVDSPADYATPALACRPKAMIYIE